MKPLCVIPARGGSKRLARKNIALLRGRPLLAWTIEAARESGIFDRIYVSTEDDEIAGIANELGADVNVRRPSALSGDEVTNVSVSLYHYDALAQKNRDYDSVVCLQPSSPLRTGSDVRAAWNVFKSARTDFVVSATPIDPHYCHWALERKADGHCAMVFGDRYMTTRQNLPDFYRPNGAIKIAKVDALRKQNNFFGPSLDVSLMDQMRSVHVSERADLALCEFYLTCN